MKRLIKSLCFVMALVMLFSTTAFAAESRASNYFMMTSTYIDRVSDSELEIWFDVVAVGQMDKLGVERIKLQRSTDGSSWTTIKTYDMDDYPEMICTNTASHSDYVTFSTANPRYYYRAYVEFYAKRGNGSSMYPDYTATV
jgi:hypothetical protein